MLSSELKETFLSLVRLGVGSSSDARIPQGIDWEALQVLAAEQGLSAIVVDGLEKLPAQQKAPKPVLLQWIGEVLQGESVNAIQQKSSAEMALLLKDNSIRTYVLKGQVIAECYPNPTHRSSADMDCFLVEEASSRLQVSGSRGFDAWEEGNAIIEKNGFTVDRSYYKNSTFYLPGLTVENHRFLTPLRGNKRLTALEKVLQGMIHQDNGEHRFEGTCLCKPPVMVSTLFLIEHSYSHFLHEGLTWKHVLDWMMFCKKHHGEIDQTELMAYVDKFGFRKFFDTYVRLGEYLFGGISEEELTDKDKMMLADTWAPLDLHETHHGIKGKLALAGNTWRARWKYKHFAEISMVKSLWVLATGVVFHKTPKLD